MSLESLSNKLYHQGLLAWNFFKPRSKADAQSIILGQIDLSLLTLPYAVSLGDYTYPILTHIAKGINDFVELPSQETLDNILQSISPSLAMKKAANIPRALGLIGLTGATIITDYLFQTRWFFENFERGLTPLAMINDLLYVTAGYQFGRLLGSIGVTAHSILSMNNHSNKEQFISRVKEDVPMTTSTLFTRINSLIKDHPEKALALYVHSALDKPVDPSTKVTQHVQEKFIQQHGGHPLSLYMVSQISVALPPEIAEASRQKSIETSLEEQNISKTYLHAVDELLSSGSRDLFIPLAKMFRNNTKLVRKPVGRGTKEEVTIIGYENLLGPTATSLAVKYSLDHESHRGKLVLHDYLKGTDFLNLIFAIDQDGDESMLFEKLITGSFFYESVTQDPRLLIEASNRMILLQEKLQDFPFEKINILEKYGSDPLLMTKEYEASLHRTQQAYQDFNDYEPIVDFHVYNLYEEYDVIKTADLEIKGLAPRTYEISNIVDLAYDLVPFRELKRIRKDLLHNFQVDKNVDLPRAEQLYLEALSRKRDSFCLARRNHVGYVPEVKPFVHYVGQVFQSYARKSTQKKLAQEELEITRSLMKTI